MAQSERWKRAADAEGFASAGAWLADAADAYLKVRARAGRPLSLAWHFGAFSAVLMDGREIQVRWRRRNGKEIARKAAAARWKDREK